MRGTIYKRTYERKNGTTSVLYYGVISLRASGTSKRWKDWGHGYRTRGEAIASLERRLPPSGIRSTTMSSGLRLGVYLFEQWLPSMVDRIEPTTYAAYDKALRRVLPRLGTVKLQDITTAQLHDLYRDLRERGGRYQDPTRARDSRPLSPTTVRGVHTVLSNALSDAVELGLLPDNPAERAKPPRIGRSFQSEAWTTGELAAFLRSVEQDPLYPIWRLAACTGMRRGELMGLRWRDIDLPARTLAVRQARTLARRMVVTTTPKSGHARVINLDDDTAAALTRLRRPADASELVVRAPDGQAMHPDRLSQLFRKLVRHAGLRPIRLHDLRHTHASLLLAAGVPVKVVTERLGHSDPGFTMRVYQHVLPGMQAEAAAAFAALVRPPSPVGGPARPALPGAARRPREAPSGFFRIDRRVDPVSTVPAQTGLSGPDGGGQKSDRNRT